MLAKASRLANICLAGPEGRLGDGVVSRVAPRRERPADAEEAQQPASLLARELKRPCRPRKTPTPDWSAPAVAKADSASPASLAPGGAVAHGPTVGQAERQAGVGPPARHPDVGQAAHEHAGRAAMRRTPGPPHPRRRGRPPAPCAGAKAFLWQRQARPHILMARPILRSRGGLALAVEDGLGLADPAGPLSPLIPRPASTASPSHVRRCACP
jgi:hypothetical protein